MISIINVSNVSANKRYILLDCDIGSFAGTDCIEIK